MSKVSQLIAIIALPFIVTVVIPFLLWLFSNEFHFEWELEVPYYILTFCIGLLILCLGLVLLIQTIRLFSSIGKGTLAPWDPPKKLVISGPYSYVRNPMISGVVMIILSESIITGSYLIFLYFIFVFALNHIYFIKSEEPNLIHRFGEEYIQYSKYVPRWIPRRNPWNPVNKEKR